MSGTVYAPMSYSPVLSYFAWDSGLPSDYSAYTMFSHTGTLPPGLSLNGTTGEISGTPTVTGPYFVTVTAKTPTFGTPTGTMGITITVSPGQMTVNPTTYTETIPVGSSKSVDASLLVSGGSGSYTFITATSNALTVTPSGRFVTVTVPQNTPAGTYPVNFTVTDSSSSVSGTFNVNVTTSLGSLGGTVSITYKSLGDSVGSTWTATINPTLNGVTVTNLQLLGTITYTWSWQSPVQILQQGNSSSYTLQQNDIGKVLVLTVTASAATGSIIQQFPLGAATDQQQVDAVASWLTWEHIRGTNGNQQTYYNGSYYYPVSGNFYLSTSIPTSYVLNGVNVPIASASINISYSFTNLNPQYTGFSVVSNGTNGGTVTLPTTGVTTTATLQITIGKSGTTAYNYSRTFPVMSGTGSSILQAASNRLQFQSGSTYVNIGGNNANTYDYLSAPGTNSQNYYRVVSNLSLPLEMSSSSNNSAADVNIYWTPYIISGTSLSPANLIDTGSNSSTRGTIYPLTSDVLIRLTATLSQKNSQGGTLTKDFYLNIKASNNQESVRLTKEWLTWSIIRNKNTYENDVYSNLNLPTGHETHGTTITWSSDRTSSISNDGEVTPPSSGTINVRLTATISKGTGSNAASDTEYFNLTVTVPSSNQDQAEAAAAAAAWWDTIKNGNPAQDEVAGDLYFPSEGLYETSLSWSSSRTSTISDSGSVTAPTSGDAVEVTITVTATKDSARVTATITVEVLPITNDRDAVTAAKNSLTWNTIRNANTEQNAVSTDLNLPTAGKYNTRITWTSSRPEIISATGKVTATQNTSVVLTASFERGSVRDSKTFTLVVTASTSASGVTETATAMTSVTTQTDFAAQTQYGTAGFTVSANMLDIAFDAKAVGTIYSQANGSIVINAKIVPAAEVPQTVRQRIGDRNVYDLTITGGTGNIANFNGGMATVRVPYNLNIGEKPNALVVYYLDSQNNLNLVRGFYDSVNREIVFKTKHFSRFAIGYNPKSYSDIADTPWATDAIEFIAARELTIGIYGMNYRPGDPLTRGVFTANLMKAYGIAIDRGATENFADVNLQDEYAPYLATGKKMGIIQGTGGNNFEPERQIGRAEMFALLYNVLKAIGEAPPPVAGGKTLSYFADSSEVSVWFREGVEALLQAGMIDGTGVDSLNRPLLKPKDLAGRATMAGMIQNLLTR
ncbi:MAG: S-layer homology domain-containing protein [Oscillospiraceae bacterium]|nr:S-layer homology domain-containing protein [Oscillospiraceae bacterium]